MTSQPRKQPVIEKLLVRGQAKPGQILITDEMERLVEEHHDKPWAEVCRILNERRRELRNPRY